MKFDLHLHSEYSWDSKVKIQDYIKRAEEYKYDAISITDHNSIESHNFIEEFQESTNVLLIPGQEISTSEGHLLVYGYSDLIPSGLSMKDSVILAKKSNSICIAAHPFDPLRGGSFSRIFETGIDGLEILNASAWFNLPNYFANRAYRKQTKIKIGLANSDSHRLEEMGSAFSISKLSEPLTLTSLRSHMENASPKGSRIGIRKKLSRLIKRKLF